MFKKLKDELDQLISPKVQYNLLLILCVVAVPVILGIVSKFVGYRGFIFGLICWFATACYYENKNTEKSEPNEFQKKANRNILLTCLILSLILVISYFIVSYFKIYGIIFIIIFYVGILCYWSLEDKSK